MRIICFHVVNTAAAAEQFYNISKFLKKEYAFKCSFICDGDIAFSWLKERGAETYNLNAFENKIELNSNKKRELLSFIKKFNVDFREIYFSTLAFKFNKKIFEKKYIKRSFEYIQAAKHILETGFKSDYFVSFAGDEIGFNLFYLITKAVNGQKVVYRESLYPERSGFATNKFGVWRFPKIDKENSFEEEAIKYSSLFVEKFLKNKQVFWGTPKEKDIHIKIPKKGNFNKYFKKENWLRLLITINRLITKKKLEKIYNKIEDINGKKYHYLPLHYPIDSQLTYRARPFINQLNFAETISYFIPYGEYLVIKEHPHARGAIDYKSIKQLSKLPNIIILHPWINSHDILENTESVIVINSTVGLEALYHQKPVILFGRNYLYGHNLATEVKEFYQLYDIFKEIKSKPDYNQFLNFLNQAYIYSYPFSIKKFNNCDYTEKELEVFSKSLINFIETKIEIYKNL